MRGHLILSLLTVDGVSVEEDVLDFGELSDLGYLVESLDLVVGNVEDGEFDAGLQTVELFDLVVGDPQLLEGRAYVFQGHNSLYVVATQGEDPQVLQLWQGDHSFYGVGAQRQFLTGLQLVQRVVHLIHGGQLTNELDLGGFSCVLAGFGLEVLYGFLARCSRHCIKVMVVSRSCC